jgi:hypothetical protein
VGIGTTLLLFLTQNTSSSSLAVQKTRPIRIASSGVWAGEDIVYVVANMHL